MSTKTRFRIVRRIERPQCPDSIHAVDVVCSERGHVAVAATTHTKQSTAAANDVPLADSWLSFCSSRQNHRLLSLDRYTLLVRAQELEDQHDSRVGAHAPVVVDANRRPSHILLRILVQPTLWLHEEAAFVGYEPRLATCSVKTD